MYTLYLSQERPNRHTVFYLEKGFRKGQVERVDHIKRPYGNPATPCDLGFDRDEIFIREISFVVTRFNLKQQQQQQQQHSQ